MILPAFRAMALDRELGGRAIRIYGLLVSELDPVAYRPVKVWALARHLGMDRGDVGRCLGRLVAKGYLDRRGRDETGVRLYRIVPCPEVESKRPA